jgi:hypothetical protein
MALAKQTPLSYSRPPPQRVESMASTSREGKKVELETMLMKIVLTSVLVDDQEKALRFYRDVLG